IAALDAYAEDRGWTVEQKKEVRGRLHGEFSEKARLKEDVRLEAISALINHEEPTSFAEFVREHEDQYPVSDGFRPHPEVYRRLKRVSGTVGTVNISFDIQELEDGTLSYNGNADTLTLNRLSPSLIRSIRQALGSE